jgi:Pvc16 N-terminal domain
MSSGLAIASVTAVLKDLLNNGLIDHDVSATVGVVKVTALAPDRVPTGDKDEESQLNLFLYQVTPNPGWRNRDLPSMDSGGRVTTNPALALDLHYLLSAYASDELHAEILLGYGMQLLHETPVLTREAVRAALAPPFPVPGGGSLPPALQALNTSALADQVELVKISPAHLPGDELTKLWTAFQAHYRPTGAYLASVVLIESERSTRPAPPVRDRNLYVVPFRSPQVDRVVAAAGEGEPILAQGMVALEGRRLRSELTRVNVAGIVVDPLQVTDTRLVVRLPAGLRAGVQGLQVVQPQLMGTPPVPHRGVESNACAFVLRPRVTDVTVSDVVDSTVGGVTVRAADVGLELDPPVGRSQRVVLLLNELHPAPAGPPPRAYSFPAAPRPPTDPPEAASLVVKVAGVVPGDYLVRVQVDGAESVVAAGADGRPDQPRVTL